MSPHHLHQIKAIYIYTFCYWAYIDRSGLIFFSSNFSYSSYDWYCMSHQFFTFYMISIHSFKKMFILPKFKNYLAYKYFITSHVLVCGFDFLYMPYSWIWCMCLCKAICRMCDYIEKNDHAWCSYYRHRSLTFIDLKFHAHCWLTKDILIIKIVIT